MIPYKCAAGCLVTLMGLLIASPLSRAQEPQKPMVYEGSVGGLRILEEGQPPAMIHATVEDMRRFREANPHAQSGSVHAAGTAANLSYHGGAVETAPQVFLVLWGSQWNSNDPSGEAGILQNFYNGVGRSSWLNSVTQYCQGVAVGTVFCNGSGTPAGNNAGILGGSGLTTRAPLLKALASRRSRPKRCARRSTSATRRPLAIRAYST